MLALTGLPAVEKTARIFVSKHLLHDGFAGFFVRPRHYTLPARAARVPIVRAAGARILNQRMLNEGTEKKFAGKFSFTVIRSNVMVTVCG